MADRHQIIPSQKTFELLAHGIEKSSELTFFVDAVPSRHVKRHTDGAQRKRGCDSISHAFGALVDALEKTRKDILGDLFQSGITYGEAGQFPTPEAVCS